MFVRYIVTVGLACVVGSTGCASHGVEAPRPEPRSLGCDIPSFQASEEPGVRTIAASDTGEPTGSLKLGDALALALMKNPELATFSWEIRAREAEELQAGLRPNPRATVETENFAGSGAFDGFDASETTVGLSQLFELGGKRVNRRSAAAQARNLAVWDYETKRIDVVTRLTKNFVALLVAQEQAALAGELVQVAERMLEAVARRVQTGGISPVEQGRAQVELQTTRIDMQSARRQVDIARHRLSSIWGATEPRFTVAEGSIEAIVSVPPLEEILAQIDDNPDVARWVTEIAQREAVVAVEKSRRIPDLELGVGVRRFAATTENALVAQIDLPIPIFNRSQGAARAAERRVAMATEQSRSTRVRVETQLAIVYQELRQSENELTRLRDEVLPEATATFESAQTAYLRGRMRLTDVLDTQRTLFALRSRYYDALGTFHQRKADIERLIGEPLTGEETR